MPRLTRASLAVELLGAAEVAVLARVSRQRVHQLRDAGDFPEPVAQLASGAIWLRQDVEAWLVKRAQRAASTVRDAQ